MIPVLVVTKKQPLKRTRHHYVKDYASCRIYSFQNVFWVFSIVLEGSLFQSRAVSEDHGNSDK